MPNSLSFELALVLLLAAIVAVPLFRRLGLVAVLAYLATGVLLGPDGIGMVRDPDRILAASEIGVVMLLFVIGLELSPSRLVLMRRPVFGAGGAQVFISALLLALALLAFGLHWKGALVAGLGLVAALVACSSSEQEVQAWMQQQRAQTKPKVEELPEPKKFTPQAYTEAAATDPFSPQKLAQALRRDSGQSAASSALVAPEMARRKEPLESFPLDAMTMVGSMVKGGRPVALVRVDNLIYQVRPGNYLGQNYGKITKVTETEVVLREIAQDAAGEWIERTATLQLQERAK